MADKGKSLLNFFLTDKVEKNDASDEPGTPSIPSTGNGASETVMPGIPGLNFSYASPEVRVQDPSIVPQPLLVAPQNFGSDASSVAPVSMPEKDEALEALIDQLHEKIKNDAGIGYKAFIQKRAEILAEDPNTSLKVILIAAGVKPDEMSEEIMVLLRSLDSRVAEIEYETSSQIQTDVSTLQIDIANAQQRQQECQDRIRSLTDELNSARQEIEEVNREIAEKGNLVRNKQSQARVLSQRLKLAKQTISQELNQEVQKFRALPQVRKDVRR